MSSSIDNNNDNTASTGTPGNSDHPLTSSGNISSCSSHDGSDHDDEGERQKGKDPSKRTQAEKKMDRILANRSSARRSRERRKKLQETLEVSIALLGKQNEELAQENAKLKQELQILIHLVNYLTMQTPGSTNDTLGLQALLQCVGAASAGNANMPQLGGGLNLNPPVANLAAAIDGSNAATAEQLLALSQIISMNNNNNNQSNNGLNNVAGLNYNNLSSLLNGHNLNGFNNNNGLGFR